MMKTPRLFSTIINVLMLTAALSADEHYLLPEHNSDLMHSLKLKIERATAVTLITGGLAGPSIARSIEKSLQRGATLHLITTDFKSAAYFSKYRNTLVNVPKDKGIKERFALNILIIDKSDICFSSVAFSEILLKRNIGEVICTTDQESVLFGKKTEKSFSDRFEAYNR